jgi:cyclophilin family peptidyl-prolyl cis-trans isomerase
MRFLTILAMLGVILMFSADNLNADGKKPLTDADVLKANPLIEMKTSKGIMKLELFSDIAPKHAQNFVKLTQDGFYNGLIFHRVIPNFMVQGGDPQGTGIGGPGYTIDAEISPTLKHVKGSLAAARQGDNVNPKRASSGSQFYICQVATTWLDGQYTIYGQVYEGLDVIDSIAAVQTSKPGDKPLVDIIIESVTTVIGTKPHS